MLKTIQEIISALSIEEKKYLKAGLFIILFIGFISIVVLPYVLTRNGPDCIDYTRTGAIGDTINGIAGPFIALLAAILTFFAFYVQYKANQQQRKQFIKSLKDQRVETKRQEKIWLIERFENRFYELIRLHKANVSEMNISANKSVNYILTGNKCFVPMFYELRFCYYTVHSIIFEIPKDIRIREKFNRINIMDLSYKIFFYGIGYNSEKYYVPYLNAYENKIFLKCKKQLEKTQGEYESAWYEFKLNDAFEIPISDFESDTIQFSYYPFDGHVSRLGHYYRHLFQTVNYVMSNKILDENEKYSYLKTLRAQLTNFEQLLLYYNALAWFEDGWKEAFTTFRFIKNIPLPLADFHIKPTDLYKNEIIHFSEKGVELFEWLE